MSIMRELATGPLARAIEPAPVPCPHCGLLAHLMSAPKPHALARPLLLVVDDEQPVLKVIERFATKNGFDVVACGSGEEAMRKLLRKPADVAMVDLRMP